MLNKLTKITAIIIPYDTSNRENAGFIAKRSLHYKKKMWCHDKKDQHDLDSVNHSKMGKKNQTNKQEKLEHNTVSEEDKDPMFQTSKSLWNVLSLEQRFHMEISPWVPPTKTIIWDC